MFPNVNQILDGTCTKLKIEGLDAKYALAVAICCQLRDQYQENNWGPGNEEFARQAANALAYMEMHFNTELKVLMLRYLITVFKLPIAATAELQKLSMILLT